MTDDRNKVTDKASEIAKNIWLAGVGAYGRAVDEAQGRLEKAGVEPPKLFRELVKAGAALEEEARDAIEAGQAARSSVEERINRVRENFNLQRPVRGEDLLALHAKIDRLADRLDILIDVLGAGAAQPAGKRVSGNRKTAATKTRRKASARAPAKTAAKSAGKAGTRATATAGTKAKAKARTTAKTPARRAATAKARGKTAAPKRKASARKKSSGR